MGKELENIEYFLEVVRCKSISKAAKKMGVAVSTVSLALQQLEEHLGHKVILRIKKGIEMTDVGKNLFTLTDQSVKNINDAVRFLSSARGDEVHDLKALKKVTRTSIRLVTTTGLMSLWIMPRLQRFIDQYPQIKIEIETIDGEVNFTETIADVGILPSVLDNKNVTKRCILSVQTYLFCSEKYIQKYGRPHSMDDLKNHKLIGYYPDDKRYRGELDWHLRTSKGEKLTPAFVVNSDTAQIYAAKMGYGIAAISPDHPYLDSSFINLFPDYDSQPTKIYFVTRRDAILDDSIDDLYFFLQQEHDKLFDE